MKRVKNSLGIAVVCSSLTCAFAARIEIETVPQWEAADTEVATNCPLRFARNPVEDVRFSLAFAGCESNNVEVAFGCDANENGTLEIGERAFSVAWDCGVWRMRNLGDAGYVCAAAVTNVDRRLDFALHVSAARAKVLSCLENGQPQDWELPEPLPSWMFDPGWNMFRLAVRGVEGRFDSLNVSVTVDGTRLIFR